MIDEIKITSLSGRGSIIMKNKDYKGYWLGVVDLGQVDGANNTYSFPNQIGESIVSTSINTRPISIQGWVLMQEDFERRCNLLNEFFSPQEDYELEYNGKKIQFRPDSSIKYATERSKNNEIKREFLLQATCAFPLFYNNENTPIPFDVSGKRFIFPTDWGQKQPIIFEITQKTYIVKVNNTGGFPTWLNVKIEFQGDVSNPRIKNLTSGEFIGVNYDFSFGQKLEMSTKPGQKYIKFTDKDGTVSNFIKNREFDMSWIQILPGENVLALDCDDLEQRVNMTATAYFTPLYMEVQ